MDLADIRQQVLSSNIPARENAEELLLQKAIYDLNRKEWRELLAGIPADVKRQIGILNQQVDEASCSCHCDHQGMTHHVLGKRLSAWSVCCGFLRTLTLDALLDSVQAASSRLSIFSVAGGFALMCWT